MKLYNDPVGHIVLAIAVCVIVGALSFCYAYLIASSDLPDWLKFWLLK